MTTKPAEPAEPPRWRLKPGASPELQAVIDEQPIHRKRQIDALLKERNDLQDTLNDVSRVARQDRDRRQWAKEYVREQKLRYQAIGPEIEAIEQFRVPAIPELDWLSRRTNWDEAIKIDPQRRKKLEVGQYPFVGATVVSVVDAHSAVIKPRGYDRVGWVGHDLDEFYRWAELTRELRERYPLLATNLASTEGWKPGDVVPIGRHWIARLRPPNADGTYPTPVLTIEAFSLDDFEPINRPTSRASSRPATSP